MASNRRRNQLGHDRKVVWIAGRKDRCNGVGVRGLSPAGSCLADLIPDGETLSQPAAAVPPLINVRRRRFVRIFGLFSLFLCVIFSTTSQFWSFENLFDRFFSTLWRVVRDNANLTDLRV